MNNNEDFIYIEDFKNDVIRMIREINIKCDKLDDIYREYIKEAVKKEEHMMSLDVLFFQIELTKQDINNYMKLFNSFISKMYGQYYKLYIKIINSIKDTNIDLDTIFNDTPINYNFNPYDDINYKEYDFEEIQNVHNVITTILNCINQYISRQKYTVEDDEIRVKKGININHLVYEKTHDIELFNQKTKLFNNILTNYYDYQKKFLRRIMLKLKLLYFQIDSDIQFESVTHSRGRSSVTFKMNNLLEENKSNLNLETSLLSELDISHSPNKKTSEIVSNNVLGNIYKILIDHVLKFLCFRI